MSEVQEEGFAVRRRGQRAVRLGGGPGGLDLLGERTRAAQQPLPRRRCRDDDRLRPYGGGFAARRRAAPSAVRPHIVRPSVVREPVVREPGGYQPRMEQLPDEQPRPITVEHHIRLEHGRPDASVLLPPGHNVFMGKDSARDVFPHLTAFLDAHAG
ncbi:hypothetical protein ACH4GK_15775 [Streptomyces rimosus]|uniref:hypothetical protein n=1 Tax=Streptomyces rimosus TaxID=1927 RepID=UPI0004C4A888|nr:hypothetical protein [Streptomyces rimosus]